MVGKKKGVSGQKDSGQTEPSEESKENRERDRDFSRRRGGPPRRGRGASRGRECMQPPFLPPSHLGVPSTLLPSVLGERSWGGEFTLLWQPGGAALCEMHPWAMLSLKRPRSARSPAQPPRSALEVWSGGLNVVFMLFCLSVRGQENGLDGGKSGGSSGRGTERGRRGRGRGRGTRRAVGMGWSGEVRASLKRKAVKLLN